MLKNTAFAVAWRHRSLLAALVKRDFLNRYTGSVAGAAWALMHPLALLALYAVVFEAIFKVKVPNLSLDQPYVLFIAVVLWPWMAFQESLSRGTTAVQNHGALVKKVAFDHELLVYSAVLTSFIVNILGYALVLLVLARRRHFHSKGVRLFHHTLAAQKILLGFERKVIHFAAQAGELHFQFPVAGL